MTDKVQKILDKITVRKLCTMDEHMAFYNDKAKEDYRFLSEIEELIKALQEEPVSNEQPSVILYGLTGSVGSPKEEPVSDELEKVVEEIVDPTVLNAYGVKDIANRLRRTMIEPVSEELEKASKEWLRPKLDKSYANYGEAKMMELTRFDGYAMLDAIEFGAQWQKAKDEFTTEDLGEYINELSKQFPEVSFAKLSRIAVRVAKWQKAKMMAKAIDGEVGYWNLHGLSVNVKLPHSVEEGDRVKVVVIKED